jgi:hypothetical protein
VSEQLFRLFEDSHDVGVCRGCGAGIDWYETLRGRRMPMNAGAVPRKSEKDEATGRVVAFFSADDSHWATCEKRDEFRRR